MSFTNEFLEIFKRGIEFSKVSENDLISQIWRILFYLLFLVELLDDFFFDLCSVDLGVFFKAARHSNITLNTVKLNFHTRGFSLSISKHMCTKSSLEMNNKLWNIFHKIYVKYNNIIILNLQCWFWLRHLYFSGKFIIFFDKFKEWFNSIIIWCIFIHYTTT